jgi:hypothetical protein
VLFAGAGLSVPAGLPTWNALVNQLAAELGRQRQENDELDIAQAYRDQPGGAAKLANLIRTRFTGVLSTLAHYLLLALPIHSVFTTNYDPLLEDTLAALKRNPLRVVREQDVAQTGKADGVYVVKFHGDAATPEEIVLCRADYEGFFRQRPALSALLRGLLLNQKFLFVGYRLRDPNFQQIYVEVATMLRGAQQPAFATTFDQGEARPTWLPEEAMLELIPIPGESLAAQSRRFLLWLDRLADQVLARTPPPFLAPDASPSPVLADFRRRLLEMGEELEEACRSPSPADALVLAGLLHYLEAHGWRPQGWKSLPELWQQLAAATDSPAERRRYLAAALRCAQTEQEKQRILRQLGVAAN